jgi:hypothetical protein
MRAMPARDRTLIAGVALALLFGLPTLLYPFGRDQGLYEYLGSGLLEGLLPYVDGFDQKPPGIYGVYAALTALTGRNMWSVRLAELLAVPLVGALAAASVGGRRVAGAGALLAAGYYFTCFDYWNTAQVELWEGLALTLSWVISRGGAPGAARVLGAGALGGLAFLFKFPAGLLALAIGLEGGWRAWRAGGALEGAGAVVRYGLGAGLVIALGALPWAAAGELATLWDVLIGYNLHYATEKPQAEVPPGAFLGALAWPYALGLGALAAWRVASAARSGDRAALVRGAGVGAALLLSAAAVAAQRKFYGYHWGLTLPAVAALGGWGLAALGGGWRALGAAAALAAAGLAAGTPWDVNPGWSYRAHALSAARYATGGLDRPSFLEPFTGRYRYNYALHEQLAAAIRGRMAPGDTLCVRGFEPAAYTLTGLRCPSRFFADFPISDPRIHYRKQEWAAEHERALAQQPPTFLVTARGLGEVPTRLVEGYVEVAEAGPFVLLHRPDTGPPPGPTVLFVVLDMVRADRLSLCGYGRPTSPSLERLRDLGAAWTCGAHAPGSWTLPSHASFFTGLPVYAHGVHYLPGDDALSMGGIPVYARPLGPEPGTLAEAMAAAGYATAMVSGNPLLGEASGLTRGFEQVEVAPRFGALAGQDLLARTARVLSRARGEGRPLFLFVNIADAHDPWPAVPEGLGWLPATPALTYDPADPGGTSPASSRARWTPRRPRRCWPTPGTPTTARCAGRTRPSAG